MQPGKGHRAGAAKQLRAWHRGCPDEPAGHLRTQEAGIDLVFQRAPVFGRFRKLEAVSIALLADAQPYFGFCLFERLLGQQHRGLLIGAAPKQLHHRLARRHRLAEEVKVLLVLKSHQPGLLLGPLGRKQQLGFGAAVQRVAAGVAGAQKQQRRVQGLLKGEGVAKIAALRPGTGQLHLGVGKRVGVLDFGMTGGDDRPVVLPRHGGNKRFAPRIVIVGLVGPHGQKNGIGLAIGALHQLRVPGRDNVGLPGGVVKKQRRVDALHLGQVGGVAPGAGWVFGRHHKVALAVNERAGHVVRAIVVVDGRRKQAPRHLVAHKIHLGRPVDDIAYLFPVFEVAAVHHRNAGKVAERGIDQIIVRAYFHHARVGVKAGQNGVCHRPDAAGLVGHGWLRRHLAELALAFHGRLANLQLAGDNAGARHKIFPLRYLLQKQAGRLLPNAVGVQVDGSEAGLDEVRQKLVAEAHDGNVFGHAQAPLFNGQYQRLRTGQDGNAAAPLLNQMLRYVISAQAVVENHLGAVHLVAHPVKMHHRDVAPYGVFNMLEFNMLEILGFARVADEQPIYPAGYQGLHRAHFGLVRLLGLANQDPVAGRHGYLLDAAHRRGEKRPLNIRDDNADGGGRLAFEALGHRVGLMDNTKRACTACPWVLYGRRASRRPASCPVPRPLPPALTPATRPSAAARAGPSRPMWRPTPLASRSGLRFLRFRFRLFPPIPLMLRRNVPLLLPLLPAAAAPGRAHDGYRLWPKYDRVAGKPSATSTKHGGRLSVAPSTNVSGGFGSREGYGISTRYARAPRSAAEGMAPGFIERARCRTPMGESGPPADSGHPTLFLASEAACYVTGVALPLSWPILLATGLPVATGLLTPLAAQAQTTQTVTGRVNGSDGAGIPGVNIIVKGTNVGTVTDVSGNYSVAAAPGSTLVFSFVGFLSQEVPVGRNATLSPVTLATDTKALEEVVVVGYGTQRAEAVTGSVVSISGAALREVPTANISQALQGRLPGVELSQSSSRPGATMQIRIRGARSLSASNDPLVVLDGIPFPGSIGDINPNDIQSIDILKDASATAIYGSRGANGVILVTTKSGKTGQKPQISYDSFIGADDVNTDWQDLLYRTGIQNNQNMGVSGGTQHGHYNFNAGYYKEQGIIPTQQYTRFSTRGTIDQGVGKYIRIGFTTNNTYSLTEGGNVGVGSALSTSTLANPYNADGSLKRTVKMPLDEQWVTTRETVEANQDRWLSETKAFATYNALFGEVRIPGSQGGSYTGQGINAVNPATISSASVSNQVTTDYTVENILSYDRTFGGKHNINALALYSASNNVFNQSRITGTDIPSDAFQYYNLGLAAGQITVNPGEQLYSKFGLLSYMGRVMYSYDDRYLLSATVRSDGSSRLSAGHKWNTYPAVSLGWNIARETFMKNVAAVTMLKLRAGYGITSNQSINPYATLGLLSTRPYNFGPTDFQTGLYVTQLPNPDLGWEYSKTWNYGLDFALLKNRLSGTIEYYVTNTEDVLLGLPLPQTSGVSSYTTNIGSTQNKGLELSLNGVILDNLNGWTWEAGLNMYANRNQITSLAGSQPRDENNWWFVGQPINVIYDYEKVGLWQKDDPYLNILEPGGNVGMIKVKYTGAYNADGTPVRAIGALDRQILDVTPKFQGGFNTRVAYKGFDLSAVGAFQNGGILISTLYGSSSYLNLLSGRRGNVKAGTVVGTVNTELPEARIHNPTDATRGNDVIGPAGQHAGPDVARARAGGVRDVRGRGGVQERQDGIARRHGQVVGVVERLGRYAGFGPVAPVHRGEGAIVARIVGFVGKGVLDGPDGRGHAGPGPAQRLRCFALHRVYPARATGAGVAADVGVVPGHHPAGKVLRAFAIAVSQAAAIVQGVGFGMVGIQQYLRVAVIGGQVDIVVRGLQPERPWAVDAGGGHVVGLLVVVLGVVAVRVRSGRCREGGNIVGVFQPPGIGQVGFGQVEAGQGFGGPAYHPWVGRQVRNGLQQIRKNGFGVDLGHRVADRGSDGGNVKFQLARAQIQGYPAKGLHQHKVVEAAEKPGLGHQRGRDGAHGGGILDDAAGRVDVREGVAP
nr:hypothetical protein [Tanacetum cinerariifolium]